MTQLSPVTYYVGVVILVDACLWTLPRILHTVFTDFKKVELGWFNYSQTAILLED